MLDVVCAIDVGTSGVRTALVTPFGEIVSESRELIPKLTPAVSGSFDPEALWTAVTSALRKTVGTANVQIGAVGVAGLIGTVLLDGAGNPAQPGADWSDHRGIGLVDEYAERASLVKRVSGRPAITSSALAQLVWLRAHNAARFSTVQRLLSPKDYVLFRLTGSYFTDLTSAAYTLLLDVHERRWSTDVAHAFSLPEEMLPELALATDVVGAVQRPAATETGLPLGTAVVAGGPDGTVGAAALIGTRTNGVVDVSGTTDVLTAISEGAQSAVLSQVLVNPYLTANFWSYGGPTGMTGGTTEWLSARLGFTNISDAIRRWEAREPERPHGADRLFVLPFLNGSRFPTWDSCERASIVGLGGDHDAVDILIASIEASAFAAREGLEALKADLSTPVLLAGGAARSSYVAQLRANVFGRPVYAYEPADATLRGVAAIAAVGANIYGSLEGSVEAMRPDLVEYCPAPTMIGKYARKFERWSVLREAIRVDSGSCGGPV